MPLPKKELGIIERTKRYLFGFNPSPTVNPKREVEKASLGLYQQFLKFNDQILRMYLKEASQEHKKPEVELCSTAACPLFNECSKDLRSCPVLHPDTKAELV